MINVCRQVIKEPFQLRRGCGKTRNLRPTKTSIHLESLITLSQNTKQERKSQFLSSLAKYTKAKSNLCTGSSTWTDLRNTPKERQVWYWPAQKGATIEYTIRYNFPTSNNTHRRIRHDPEDKG
ncbi:hypothetical protein ACLOJK_000164 [Asimina triloba]